MFMLWKERHPTNVGNICDGMAILQKLKLPAGATS